MGEKKNLWTHSETAPWRPEAATDITIGFRDAAKGVKQQPHGAVGNVFGEDDPSIGNCDSSAPALRLVDVVEAGAGRDDAAKPGEALQDFGINAGEPRAQDRPHRRHGGGQEPIPWQRRFPWLKEAEFLRETLV